MIGRRHVVHASVHEDLTAGNDDRNTEKAGFFTRKIGRILRRSSIGTPFRVRHNETSTVAPAMPGKLPVYWPTSPRGMTVIDNEVVFGSKGYGVASSSGARQSNEDRFRVITSLELFGKGVITADRRFPSYQAAVEHHLLEVFVTEQNAPKIDVKKLLKHKNATNTEFYGVFDGHGGATCSAILALLFPLYLLLSTDFQTNLIAAAKRACLAINDEILRREAADLCEGGSTGLSVMIRNRVVYCCNTGDCRAILVSRGEVKPLTTDHKAGNELEKQRIEDAGGMVLYVRGIARVNGRLAVSRAFGDSELQEYVIANPEISCHELTQDDEYIVLGSDGLWDVLTNEAVATCIRNNPWLSIEDLSKALMNRAIELGSSDNITVIVIDVRKR
ncbi:hypothetical protein P43SY_008923 [Pythium insidiosum]|uniref:PPM-type phosphatase domain-containing protein n=1 Tax=Pythium insidiosum TaxID=114742 RepID=A0AAD5LFZ0_PYTIN|nr:hypothetical protein P43SY_008923 [Pythium insidiosum]